MSVREIKIETIQPNGWNPNVMSEEEYDSLVGSIKQTEGKFLKENPIIIRPSEDGFEIIDGEHRWNAARDLGYADIWCDIRDLTDQEAIELTVILNKDRGQINYFKLSKLLNEFYESYSHDVISCHSSHFHSNSERI